MQRQNNFCYRTVAFVPQRTVFFYEIGGAFLLSYQRQRGRIMCFQGVFQWFDGRKPTEYQGGVRRANRLAWSGFTTTLCNKSWTL